MPTKFDIALLEKPGNEGLTKANCMDLYDMLNEPEGYPIEIPNTMGESSAMGFITPFAAEKINYEYKGLTKYLQEILGDMEKETENGCYVWNQLNIYMSR